MDLTKLSGGKLEALINKRNEADYAVTREACQLGLGQVDGLAMRRFAVGAETDQDRRLLLSDPSLDVNGFARRCIAAWDSAREARDEMDARRRYHGSTRPIKRGD